jgi:hypothetical protein
MRNDFFPQEQKIDIPMRNDFFLYGEKIDIPMRNDFFLDGEKIEMFFHLIARSQRSSNHQHQQQRQPCSPS